MKTYEVIVTLSLTVSARDEHAAEDAAIERINSAGFKDDYLSSEVEEITD